MSSVLAFLLLLDWGMFSPPPPPPGLLGKIFQYIDVHQDEFVQVGDLHTQNVWIGVPVVVQWKRI